MSTLPTGETLRNPDYRGPGRPRKFISEELRQQIESAIQAKGSIRAAHRYLTEQGINISYRQVWRISQEMDTNTFLEAKVAQLQAQCNSLQQRNAYLLRRMGEMDNYFQTILATIKPIAIPHISTPRKSGKSSPIEMVLLLSDLHIGQIIRPEDTNGWNAYNYAIAERRMDKLVNCIARYHSIVKRGYRVSSLTVLGLGDYIHGEIHDEYIRTNEMTIPEAIVASARLMARGLSALLQIFSTVKFHALLVDNHARMTKEKPSSMPAELSHNYTLFEILRGYMQKQSKRFELRTYDALRADIKIGNFTFLCEHGDTVKTYLSIPLYGMSRADLAQAKRHLQQNQRYDYHVWAHWHVPMIAPFGIVNGTFAGIDAYAASRLPYAAFVPPSQWTFLVHPEHGVFNLIDWNLRGVEDDKGTS